MSIDLEKISRRIFWSDATEKFPSVALSVARQTRCTKRRDRDAVFAGDYLDAWTGFRAPLDILGDAEDNIFVTDLIPTMSMLSPDDRIIGRCRPVLNGAHGIWGDSKGNLFLPNLTQAG